MAEPRIFQGTPLAGIPLKWHRSMREREPARDRATQVAPGVWVQVMAWGDFVMPDGRVGSGARIAVWDERRPRR